MLLVAASNFFGAEFSNVGTSKMLTQALLGLDMSPNLILMLVMALVFLLGWPLEWVQTALIVAPMLLPTVVALYLHGFESRYDMLMWLGILVALKILEPSRCALSTHPEHERLRFADRLLGVF